MRSRCPHKKWTRSCAELAARRRPRHRREDPGRERKFRRDAGQAACGGPGSNQLAAHR
ncbi:unnamed protein product, partial [Heterosigma akashiwo]